MKNAESGGKLQREKIGNPEYVNQNCWLAKAVNRSPVEHCQYCELRFGDCLFFQYLKISLILTLILVVLSFFIEGKISNAVIISIFLLIIVYGRFFSQSTEKIIKANFAEKKAKESFEKLAGELEEQVKQRTEELKESYEELKKLDKSKDQFLLMAQHQLRTPLSGIKWLIETLQGKALGEISLKQKEYLDDIYKMNERMIKLVFDMLNAVRLESGTVTIKKEIISIPDFYGDLTALMIAPAKNKGVILRNVLKNHKEVEINTDLQILKTILECFVCNAINYSASGQEILLDAKEEKDNIIFFVKDSGIGIPEEEQKKIFKRFYRASNAKMKKPDGTGLGLYLALILAKKIGGKVYFESKDGKGSTFYLSIPKKVV